MTETVITNSGRAVLFRCARKAWGLSERPKRPAELGLCGQYTVGETVAVNYGAPAMVFVITKPGSAEIAEMDEVPPSEWDTRRTCQEPVED